MQLLAKEVALLLLMITANQFAKTQTASIQPDELKEISGLVSSSYSDSVFFVVNDSGDSSRFFAIDTNGRLLETFTYRGVNIGLRLGVVDCEELSEGPGPGSDKTFLYVGDIGDNNGVRPFITLYGFEEPPMSGSRKALERFAIHLKYPDHPRDAEAFVIDPIMKTICIISKREDSVGIYETSLAHRDGDTAILEKKGTLYIPRKARLFSWQPTAADISRDGKQFLLKTYGSVYYWKRNENESIADMLTRAPTSLPYTVESQGESIAFNRKGTAYYCVSEGLHPVIYRYELKGVPNP